MSFVTILQPILDAAQNAGEDWKRLNEGADELLRSDLARKLTPMLEEAIRAICATPEKRLLTDPATRDAVCDYFRDATGYRLTATEVYCTKEDPLFLRVSFFSHSRPPIHFVY